MYIEYRKSAAETASTPENWYANFSNTPRFGWQANLSIRLSSVWPACRRYLPRGGRVLDAGCGAGDWVLALHRVGYQAEGIDYSPQLIERLREYYPQQTWSLGRLQNMPYADAIFDGIISWGVIEHDPDGPAAQLKEFHRILRPQGRIVVTVPKHSPAMVRASTMSYPNLNRENAKFFQHFYTRTEFADILQEAEFRVLELGDLAETSPALLAPRLYARTEGRHAGFQALRYLCRMQSSTRTLAGVHSASRSYRFCGMIYAVAEKRS